MERKYFEKVIRNINEAKVYSIYDAEDLFCNDNFKCVKENLDLDKHRWYTISTSIYNCGEYYLGIRGVSAINSEEMSVKDASVVTEAFEVKRFVSYDYRKKD